MGREEGAAKRERSDTRDEEEDGREDETRRKQAKLGARNQSQE